MPRAGLCRKTYIYIARIPSRIPSHLTLSFRENTYIYDAHTLAHTRALMCTKVYIYIYIYIVRIPSRIPVLHKHAFPDRLAGTALRGTPFPWAAHTPRIPKSVSSKAWRAHWLLSGPRKEKETKPGNRARRWGTLENKVPEEGWRINLRTPEIEHAVGDR